MVRGGSRVEETEYGFTWGAAEVTRICSAHDAKGWVVVGVNSPKHKIQIYVTKTGKIRIYKDGKEMVDG